MKIGILTFHSPCNFGANLQAYSSSSFFKELGHEVYVINYIRFTDSSYKNNVSEKQYLAHQKFINSNLQLTKKVNHVEQLTTLISEYSFDLILVGADAVWRSPKKDSEQIYFMTWLFNNSIIKNTPVVSMSAAHMGDGFKNLSKHKRLKIADSLSKFKYISVRDIWTKKMLLRDIPNTNELKINLNPDPVFLLDKYISEKWNNKNNKIHTKKYIILTLEKNWNKIHTKKRNLWFKSFKKMVNNKGLLLIELPLPEGKSGMKFDYSLDYPIDPIQWFLWIKNAKAFCGLRFHSIVSSIASGTPFFSVDSYGNSSIPILILKKIGLYKIARLFDQKSKIRNLLQNTKFSSYRVPSKIELISPSNLLKKLNKVNLKEIEELRQKNIKIFEQNMSEMLNKISND